MCANVNPNGLSEISDDESTSRLNQTIVVTAILQNAQDTVICEGIDENSYGG